MSYREWRPPAALAGLVECGWTAVSSSGERVAVLPDGCMDLVWNGAELLVAGPDTAPQPADRPAGTVTAGLRFAPGALPALLAVPAGLLRDRRVPLVDLHPAVARPALSRLEGGGPPLPLLADLVRRLPGESPDPSTAAVARWLAPDRPPHRRVDGDPSVAAVAEAVGITPRTLHRRCHDAFGYGPAVLRRVLRFRRAVALLHLGLPPAEVAARAGYADQPHLSREVRALAGRSPRQLASGANRSTPLPSGSRTTA